MDIPSHLISAVSRGSDRQASSALQALIDEILVHHGEAGQAILFYGSCLRTGDEFEGLVDLYLLVDDYRNAYKNHWQVLFNSLLPPNVYYLEIEFEGRIVRTKYAVLSLADFQKGTSERWFHSYLWGRFCQPTALLFARNDQVRALVQNALAQSVLTFMRRVLPRLEPDFDACRLWRKGLELSYRAELRSERPEKRARLFDASPEYYKEITDIALKALPYSIEIIDNTGSKRYRHDIAGRVRFLSRFTWRLRSLQGKLLSVLRLLKAATTFEGGVDYILWKIQRHSGVSVDVSPGLRRHPFLAMWVLSWQLYRRGGFR
jgi:hypothetical protein